MIHQELGNPFSVAQGETGNDLSEKHLEAIASGYTSTSGTVQIDDAALPRLTAVLAELRAGDADAHGGFWIMADNSRVEMTGQDCESLLADAIQRRLEIDQIFFTARDEIAAAATIEEVNAVAFDFGGE